MVDYIKETGVNGQLLIKDLGEDVEFWFKAGYTSDTYPGLVFNYSANGSTTTVATNYPTGAPWYKVGTRVVTKEQTVTFRLATASGVRGIGGPTTFTQLIDRDKKPGAPTTPQITGITGTTVSLKFTDGSNGGDPIDEREIGFGTLSSAPQSFVSSSGSSTIHGLNGGTLYYFWAHTHNSEGWGPWSGRTYARTLQAPDAPTAPLISSITATSVDLAFNANGSGGSPITAYQIGYGTSSTIPPATVISGVSPQVINNLTPGTTYYFRLRARNALGWSSWSSATSAKTVSGAYVKVGNTWKLAIPYVRVGGVWKMAETWTRNVGVWKRTT